MMKLILPFLAAALMVTGQSFWKKAAIGKEIIFTKDFLLSKEFLSTFVSFNFIAGTFLYICATVLVFYLFTKYPFYLIQSSILVFAIILSMTISRVLFNDTFTPTMIVGIGLLLVGILLIYHK